jgi:hypothetical protein
MNTIAISKQKASVKLCKKRYMPKSWKMPGPLARVGELARPKGVQKYVGAVYRSLSNANNV